MSRLVKSRKDRMVFGVCGGLSNSTGLDAALIRLAFVIGAIFTGSILFWIYLLLGIVLPTDSE